MALAALPMANSATGPGPSCRRTSSTQPLPFTARTAESKISSRRRREFMVRVAWPRTARASALGNDLEPCPLAVAARGLGHVRTLGLQASEIFGRDVTGDVVTGET